MRGAYQQQRSVDVDVLEHNKLLFCSDREQPRTVQLGFHPVPHVAVLPFEGSGQSPGSQEEVGTSGSERNQLYKDLFVIFILKSWIINKPEL